MLSQHKRHETDSSHAVCLPAAFAGRGAGVRRIRLTPPRRTIAPARAADPRRYRRTPAGAVRPLAGPPPRRSSTATPPVGGPDPRRRPGGAGQPHRVGQPANVQRVIDLPGPATALTGDNGGTAYLSARGGYFVVDLSTGRAVRVSVSDAGNVEFTAITRRSDGTLVLGTADGTLYTLTPGATDVDTEYRSMHTLIPLAAQGNTIAVSGPRADVGHHDRRRRQCRAVAARRPGRDHHGGRSGWPIAGGRHPGRSTVGVRGRPADPASGLPGSAVSVWRGRIPRAGLGVADFGEYGHWLRSVNRNSTWKRYGTQPCGNPTRWPSMKRRTRCMWFPATAGVFRSSNTQRRAAVDGGAARSHCRRAGTPRCPTITSGRRCVCRRK